MTHTQSEDMPWKVEIGDHPQRADSDGYKKSRKLMQALCIAAGIPRAGIQDHHGGAVWLLDEEGWFWINLPLGIEWSFQFMADPAKVDNLRQLTARLVAKFPRTIPGYEAHGYHDAPEILQTVIMDAAGVARWVDSPFNASMPLTAAEHTGVLHPGKPDQHGGVHHYPKPCCDGDQFRREDFTFWVTDSKNIPVAVVPVAPRGSGVSRVQVVYADPGSTIHRGLTRATLDKRMLVLDENHYLAQQAFALQEGS